MSEIKTVPTDMNDSPLNTALPHQRPIKTQADQKIHRIVDFFSAAHTIVENGLYVPLAANFEDPNEGIASALVKLAAANSPCARILGNEGFSSPSDFKGHQQALRQHSYVSCWTSTKESVAMWALYSKDFSSVQMTTTVGKLQSAMDNWVQSQQGWLELLMSGGSGQVMHRPEIVKVKYLSIAELGVRIDRRRRAFKKAEFLGLVKPLKGSLSKRSSERLNEYSHSAFELKDLSFAHEGEIRAIIASTPYSPETLESAAHRLVDICSRGKRSAVTLTNISSFEVSMNALSAIAEEGKIARLQCPHWCQLPLAPNFITEVSIDPRCSPHKRKFIEAFFTNHGVSVVPSSCFGYAGDQLSARSII